MTVEELAEEYADTKVSDRKGYNARLFNSERGAIDEAQRMLKHKKNSGAIS